MENQTHIESDIVYRDDDYTLFREGGSPCLMAGGRRFLLGCHPYEPCLHITEEDGTMTLIHNAFNPYDLLDVIREGRCFSSITGRRYSARDFCRLVEFAAGKGEMGIDDAEKVFGEKPIKEKAGGPSIIKVDPALELLRRYPDLVPEYCLVRNESAPPERNGMAPGPEAHRWALEQACRHLMAGDEETGAWQYDTALARPDQRSVNELFAPGATAGPVPGKLSYRQAFLHPPYGNVYSAEDFERLNAALFPAGTERLEVFEWSTDWSDYFDDGHEWWGALCLTLYDPALDRFVVILASATD